MDYVRAAGEEVNVFMEKLGFERHQVPAALIGYNALLWTEYAVRAPLPLFNAPHFFNVCSLWHPNFVGLLPHSSLGFGFAVACAIRWFGASLFGIDQDGR